MNTRIRGLSGAIHLALFAGLISFPGAAAFAQQDRGDDAQKLDTIQVTGSRIKKAEVEGQSPVQVITSADIEATGLGSIGDVIQRLAVSGSCSTPSSIRPATSASARMVPASARVRPPSRCATSVPSAP